MSDRDDQPQKGPIDGTLPPEPTATSTLDELATYALLKQSQIIDRDKKNGEDLWLMGRALELAYQQSPYGTWERWWKAKGFKKTYVWHARKLHKAATLDQVKDLGLTEALVSFGVVAAKDDPTDGTSGTGCGPQEQEEAPQDQGGEPVTDVGEQPDEALDEDDPADDHDKDEPESDGPEDAGQVLEDEEDKDFKDYQAAIRKLTPLSKAVAIRNALELLLDDVIGEEIEEELQDTFDQIVELVEALGGLNGRDDEQAPELRLLDGNEELAGRLHRPDRDQPALR